MTGSPANSAIPAFDVAGLLEMMLSLALVIGLIIALSWAIGRMRGMTRSTSGTLNVLAETAVGPKERIVLVRIGDRQALLGVSSAGVHSLQLLDANIEVPAEAVTAPFASKLKEIMTRSGISK